MNEIKIILKDRIGVDLGPRNQIEKIFNEIDENTAKVIMDFKDIEFMGRSFAQEYLNQKHFAQFDVIEENLPENIEKMFNMILELNNQK